MYTAGNQFGIEVFAIDEFENVIASYSGTPEFYSNNSLFDYMTNSPWTDGRSVYDVYMNQSGFYFNFTLWDGSVKNSTYRDIDSNMPVDFYFVQNLTTNNAGNSFDIDVYAKDMFNNTVTGYVGAAAIPEPQRSTAG